MPQSATRPLYKSLAHAAFGRDPTGHAGLWHDKLCNQWNVEPDGKWTLADGKLY